MKHQGEKGENKTLVFSIEKPNLCCLLSLSSYKNFYMQFDT